MGVNETQILPIAEIRMDGGTQARAEIDAATVESYRSAMDDGTAFPALTVFHDGSSYWLADGFHRLAAHIARGLDHASADVRAGTREDAILYAAGANKIHGLRRTNADKRRAVEMLLACEKWAGKSDRWIAEQTGVSDKTVSAQRKATAEVPQLARIGQDGKTRKMPDPQERRPAKESAPSPVLPPVTNPDNADDAVVEKKIETAASGYTPKMEKVWAGYAALDAVEQTAFRERMNA